MSAILTRLKCFQRLTNTDVNAPRVQEMPVYNLLWDIECDGRDDEEDCYDQHPT